MAIVVTKPWGSFTVLANTKTYKVKIIAVRPGKRLSLQRHKFRDEHWVVVRGEAKVTIDEKVFDLGENQSTYITKGTIHRLENIGDQLLKLIEVQYGSYCTDDDIERLQDDFGRVKKEVA